MNFPNCIFAWSKCHGKCKITSSRAQKLVQHTILPSVVAIGFARAVSTRRHCLSLCLGKLNYSNGGGHCCILIIIPTQVNAIRKPWIYPSCRIYILLFHNYSWQNTTQKRWGGARRKRLSKSGYYGDIHRVQDSADQKYVYGIYNFVTLAYTHTWCDDQKLVNHLTASQETTTCCTF